MVENLLVMIWPHCTRPICFPLWKRQCFYSAPGVDDSLINVTTTIQASPSLFLWDIFRRVWSTIRKWKGKELFLLMLVLPLQCGDSWWAGASIRHERPKWVGVRLRALLRGEPVTQVIGQLVTGDRPVDFHSLLFLGSSRSVLSLERSHNILLSIVKVIGFVFCVCSESLPGKTKSPKSLYLSLCKTNWMDE